MSDCSHCGADLASGALFCSACGAPAVTPDVDELLASSASDPTGLLDRLRAATDGEFVIIRELGRGGMGRVYLAHETALDRRVALKVLPPELTEHSEIVQRFQREARTAGKLAHPHIVHVYQVLERGGLHFFTMPYVAGPNVRQVLKRTPQLEVELCLRYVCEAAGALAFAHGHGVVHRDIKPENMLLEGSRDGRLLLTDFGIAKPLESVSTITRPGDRMGTPYYMSPEQCREREPIDGRSDQYSLGLVAYEMLSGRFPFTAESLTAMAYKHVHEYPQPLESVRPDVPEAVRSVIERAFRKDPADRFPTMGVMLEALQAARRGVPAPGPAMARRRASRRGRRFAWAIGSAVAVVIAAISVVFWQDQERPGRSAIADTTGAATASEQEAGGVGFDVAPVQPDSGAGQVAGLDPSAGGDEPPAKDAARSPDASEPSGAAPKTAAELRTARRQADQARNDAESARRSALDQGADTLFPGSFADLDDRLATSIAALDEGQWVAAAIGFFSVRSGFLDLSQRVAGHLADLEAAATAPGGEAISGDSLRSSPADEGPSEGDRPSVLATAEDAIRSRIESYRAAFEAEDLDRLRRDLYGGPLPEADAAFLSLLFESAERFDVTIEIEALTVDGEEAAALVRQRMEYRLSVTHEARSHELPLRMIFQRRDSGWRLVRLQQR